MAALVLLAGWVLVLFAATNAAAYSQWRATRDDAVDSTGPSCDDAADPSSDGSPGRIGIDSQPPESAERARDDRRAYGRRDDVGAVADD
ncbi:hypothetical protein SAMN04515672_0268 [Natronorubrum texcoconense]|uniref:Uncharacterized protein n=2 Tax=Natronorubrum texcoconense TaxID=1095776 RepID=A0A1G8T0B4_9EURY|nr:hypothetical protein SAMN04515672_0268 [Natronorubrum texcoconense]